ncbi:unnamed protein product [Protopolystoma xenopodis]|uniref:Uncharacterized protein n=1 Tax=Protopolystoma xenopodis TaxID=117903 RepID=A0A448WDL5_9PLAT|nr:unnamed protein product [Protopolystoma xenopodis]
MPLAGLLTYNLPPFSNPACQLVAATGQNHWLSEISCLKALCPLPQLRHIRALMPTSMPGNVPLPTLQTHDSIILFLIPNPTVSSVSGLSHGGVKMHLLVTSMAQHPLTQRILTISRRQIKLGIASSNQKLAWNTTQEDPPGVKYFDRFQYVYSFPDIPFLGVFPLGDQSFSCTPVDCTAVYAVNSETFIYSQLNSSNLIFATLSYWQDDLEEHTLSGLHNMHANFQSLTAYLVHS